MASLERANMSLMISLVVLLFSGISETVPMNHRSAELERAAEANSPRSSDIVINSLDEGLLVGGKRTSERHLYEQNTDLPVAGDQSPSKPEPRNQQDEQQSMQEMTDQRSSNSASELGAPQHQDQLASGVTQVLFSSTTTSPIQQQTSTTTNPPQVNSPPVSAQVQQSAGNGNWYQQSSSPVMQQQQSQQPQQQTSQVQHPTSINSIIAGGSQTAQELQPQTSQVIAPGLSQQGGQVVSVNGQPMLLVNPNQVNNGRRISISGWLRGISSMLANIFNRREHGGQVAASTASGHWIQLGPNAPHWLTQAQTTIQQQQQQFQQQAQMLAGAANSRFASFLSPQASQPAQNGAQAAQIIQIPNYQQQTDPMQASAATTSTNFVTVQTPTGQQVAQYQSAPAPVQPAPAPQTTQVRQQWSSSTPATVTSATSTTNIKSPPARQQVAPSGNLPLAHYSGNYASNVASLFQS